jgi:FlaA1/EpsC-like NDP-sugar epimerase
MLKEHPSFVKQNIAGLDCCLLFGAFSLAYYLVSPFKSLSPLFTYWPMFIGFIGFYLYFAWTRELFSVLQFNWMTHLFGRTITIFLSAGVLGAAILYILPDTYNSRTLYVIFAIISFFIIVSEKMLIKAFFSAIRRRNKNTTPIILFGRGRMAAQLCKELLSHP